MYARTFLNENCASSRSRQRSCALLENISRTLPLTNLSVYSRSIGQW